MSDTATLLLVILAAVAVSMVVAVVVVRRSQSRPMLRWLRSARPTVARRTTRSPSTSRVGGAVPT